MHVPNPKYASFSFGFFQSLISFTLPVHANVTLLGKKPQPLDVLSSLWFVCVWKPVVSLAWKTWCGTTHSLWAASDSSAELLTDLLAQGIQTQKHFISENTNLHINVTLAQELAEVETVRRPIHCILEMQHAGDTRLLLPALCSSYCLLHSI